MRVVGYADLHGMLPGTLPEGDVLVLAGDICVDGWRGEWGAVAQANWLAREFIPWAAEIEMPIVMTWGNHDWVGQRGLSPTMPPHVHLLVNEAVTIDGITVWGSPWTPPFGSWAYMAQEEVLREMYAGIPEEAPMWVVHGPPWGACDKTLDGRRVGSCALRAAVERLQPDLVICGHIHEGRGETKIGGTRIVNASRVNARYQPVHPAWTGVIDGYPKR